MNPVVNVPAPKVTVNEKEVDLSPLTILLGSIEQAVKDSKIQLPDNADLREDTQAISKAIKSLSFPVPNYILPFKDVNGKAVQVVLDSSGNVPTTNGDVISGNQQTKITDGTNIANILGSDGTAAGQNAQLTAGTHLSVPFTTTTAQAVGETDAANYSWVSVHIVTQGGSSTVNFQGSNNGVNWVTVSLTGTASIYASTAATTVAGTIFSGSLNYRYFRLNVTGIASGTTAGTIVFFSVSRSPTVYPVASATTNTASLPSSQSGTWTVGANSATGSAVPANAHYMGAKGPSNNLAGLQTASIATGQFDTGLLGAGILVNGTSDFKYYAVAGNNAADGMSTSISAFTWSQNAIFNGTSWDRTRSNTTGVVIAAGATTSNAGISTTTYNASKAVIIVNISAFTSGSLTVAINGITSSGYSYPILTSAALAAAAVTPVGVAPVLES